MFTGIITDIGTVRAVETKGDTRVVIDCDYDLSSVDLGASIACSGVCLTVVEKNDASFAVDVSGETMTHTAASMWQPGARLNLERALKLGDELGGHIVTGHVDGVGQVVAVAPEGASLRLTIALPPALAPYVAQKGSITVDGVSLTVNEVVDSGEGSRFGVNIIPHTAAATTLGGLAPGASVNLEIDVLARYLHRMRQVDHSAM